MTKKKQIVILGCVFACAAALYAASTIYINHRGEKDDSEYNVTSLTASDIEKIKYSNSDKTIEFAKGENGWYYVEDKDLEVDQDYINELLSSVCNITSSKKIESPDSLLDYGLDKPSYTITLASSNEQVSEIKIGNETTTFSYYVMVAGDSSIYTIDNTLMDSLRFEKSSFEAEDEEESETSEGSE